MMASGLWRRTDASARACALGHRSWLPGSIMGFFDGTADEFMVAEISQAKKQNLPKVDRTAFCQIGV